MERSNPARRLLNILTAAQAGVTAGGRQSSIAGHVWARVFNLPAGGKTLEPVVVPKVISGLLEFQKLIEETEESLRAIEGIEDLHFTPFGRIRALPIVALSALNTEMNASILGITEGDLTVLKFCCIALDKHHVEAVIDEKELAEIVEEVNSLFDSVASSDIDPDLKSVILDCLEAIRRGIFEYRIRGPIRLKETLSDIVGTLYVNHGIIEPAKSGETVQKLLDVCYRFAAVVSFASDGIALLTAARGSLLPGGG